MFSTYFTQAPFRAAFLPYAPDSKVYFIGCFYFFTQCLLCVPRLP